MRGQKRVPLNMFMVIGASLLVLACANPREEQGFEGVWSSWENSQTGRFSYLVVEPIPQTKTWLILMTQGGGGALRGLGNIEEGLMKVSFSDESQWELTREGDELRLYFVDQGGPRVSPFSAGVTPDRLSQEVEAAETRFGNSFVFYPLQASEAP